MRTHPMHAQFAFGLLAMLAAPAIGNGQTLTLQNDTGVFLEVWVFRQALNSWTTLNAIPGKDVVITPQTAGLCRLVARDPAPKRDFEIGWVNLRELALNNQSPVIRLKTVVMQEAVMVKVQDARGNVREEKQVLQKRMVVGEWLNVKKLE